MADETGTADPVSRVGPLRRRLWWPGPVPSGWPQRVFQPSVSSVRARDLAIRAQRGGFPGQRRDLEPKTAARVEGCHCDSGGRGRRGGGNGSGR